MLAYHLKWYLIQSLRKILNYAKNKRGSSKTLQLKCAAEYFLMTCILLQNENYLPSLIYN
ncbi:hypothetical protein BpHYR1_012468 [Brachionus plicatilis]|uniref:Uncharacterized protein n=1 Tax=Brachionus plicatilis TaxID=10195 RepID=A0A3M7Q2N1_BRAPC|nr:hypothetical protein BpHYR1_012468 [Brachionus plicatilis]